LNNTNKKCIADECLNEYYAKGYCYKHYKQFKRLGYIKNRTYRDRNEFLKIEDIYEIFLYDMDANVINKAIIDLDDYERCKRMKWAYDSSTGYTTTTQADGKKLYLHKYIFGDCKIFVDHINRNKLDCRKINLREATFQESAMNQSLRSDNTSGIRGVSYYKRDGTWEAYIRLNKRIGLGRFANIENAIIIRLKAELKYFGKEFAPQRHLFEQYGIA